MRMNSGAEERKKEKTNKTRQGGSNRISPLNSITRENSSARQVKHLVARSREAPAGLAGRLSVV